jgi:hypothetical protein
MEQQLPAQQPDQEERTSYASGHALWHRVHRPRRGRLTSQQVELRGPYETSYSITAGYPDREVLRP